MKKLLFIFTLAFTLVSIFAANISISAELWASKRSNNYHYPDCRWAQKRKPENLDNYILELRGLGSYDFPGLNDVKNCQTSGNDLRGSLEIQRMVKKRNGRIDLAVEPFIRYRNIEKSRHSDLILNGVKFGEAWKPKNYSTEYGVNLIIRF